MKTHTINVGPMMGWGTAYLYLARELQEALQSGISRDDEIVWDLTMLPESKVSIRALTVLLGLIERASEFFSTPMKLDLPHRQRAIEFLYRTDFLGIIKRNNICQFDERYVGGFKVLSERLHKDGRFHSSTQRLLRFAKEESTGAYNDMPPIWSRSEEASEIKRRIRNKVNEQLWSSASDTFLVNWDPKEFYKFEQLRAWAFEVSKELVANAHLWGRSSCYLGMQTNERRGSASLCIADSGLGLAESLGRSWGRDVSSCKSPDLVACIIASIVCSDGWGLNSIIKRITEIGGTVFLSTGNAEVRWTSETFKAFQLSSYSPEEIESLIEMKKSSLLESVQKWEYEKNSSFYRVWPFPIRGTRLSLELYSVSRI
jgi:hypothetical protein